jgi:sec-independent protein translocase protein TatC
MPLVEHLRELRTRLVVSLLAITAGAAVGWALFQPVFDTITQPFIEVVRQAQADGKDIQLALTGVTDPFTLQLKVALVTGIVVAAPVWLFQLWRFVTPGLHRHERRWALGFAATATPLFFAGVFLAYRFLPQALAFLFGFTPDGVANIVDVTRYLSFFLQTILIFGVGFLLPLLAVLLNFAGVLAADTFVRAWRWIALGVFVFAAMATPDGSPVTMVALAVPILGLIGLAMLVAWANDRRRGRRAEAAATADDRRTPIEPDSAPQP